jgi:hypothetical protein
VAGKGAIPFLLIVPQAIMSCGCHDLPNVTLIRAIELRSDILDIFLLEYLQSANLQLFTSMAVKINDYCIRMTAKRKLCIYCRHNGKYSLTWCNSGLNEA